MEALLSCARCQRHCHRRKASPLSLPTKSCQPHLPVVKVEETKAVTFGSSPAALSNMFKQHGGCRKFCFACHCAAFEVGHVCVLSFFKSHVKRTVSGADSDCALCHSFGL